MVVDTEVTEAGCRNERELTLLQSNSKRSRVPSCDCDEYKITRRS